MAGVLGDKMLTTTKRRWAFRASALTLALAAGAYAGWAPPAAAQAKTGATATAPVALDIPAGPLGEALIDLSRATGLRVVADPGALAGRTTRGAVGTLTVDQALTQLLKGQDLVYQRKTNMVIIRPGKRARQAEASPVNRESPVETASRVDEVVVVSTRRDASSSAFHAPQPVSMLSAADLQHTATHNAAEILGLLPSVNVMQNGSSFLSGSNAYAIDGASRGEGQFVSIRGMNSEYNVTLLNGVEVAQAQAYSRAVQLNLLPPSAVQTVVLRKTSTPDMNGDAIGGTIDFRTPTAFDFKARQSGSISVSGRLESQARRLHSDDGGFGVAADYARKLDAEEHFGVYVSGYYSIRNYANSLMGGLQAAASGDDSHAYAVVDAKGANPAGVDPAANTILAGMNIGVSSGRTKMWGGATALDWRPDADTSVYLRGSYARFFTTQNSSLNQIIGEHAVNREGRSPFKTDLDGNFILDQNGAKIVSDNVYKTDAAGNYLLDGDGQKVFQGKYVDLGNGRYGTTIPFVSNRLWYETNPERAELTTVSLGMDKRTDGWTIAPNVFYSYGRNDRPDHLELWTTSVPTGGSSPGAALFGRPTLVTYNSSGYPVPRLTPDMERAAANPGSMPGACCYEKTTGLSEQTKYGARIDVSRERDGDFAHVISGGLRYVRSSREVSNRDWTVNEPNPRATVADDSVLLKGYFPGFPGQYGYKIPNFDLDELSRRFSALTNTKAKLDAASDVCTGSDTAWQITTNDNCNTLSGSEAVWSGYVSTVSAFGDAQIVAGLRYEKTLIHNRYWVRKWDQSGDEVLGAFESNRSTYAKLLPSIALTYRPTDRSVYRASLWTSYTRPAFFQLGGSATQSYDPASRATTITRGNPDLKAIDAINVDVSAGWTFEHHGYLSVGAYYKRLSNYIYSSGSNYVNADGDRGGLVIINQPRNGGDGEILGVELEAQQKLSVINAALENFSVGGNLSAQHTQVDIGTSWGRHQRMQNAPTLAGNIGVFYAGDRLSVDVLYRYTSDFLQKYDLFAKGSSWSDVWVRPTRRLDLHAGYRLGRINLDLSVENLTGTNSYWSHVGRKTFAISDIVQSGRTALLTAKYSF